MSLIKKLTVFITIVTLLLITFLFAASYRTQTLKPFTSDGCSAFPDGTRKQKELWLTCCTAHDFAYWKGGSYNDRLIADKKLQACVAEVGRKKTAALMLAGVRVGGSPFWPTSFRWGYGWSYPRFYKPLSESELELVKKLNNLSLTSFNAINKSTIELKQ